MTGRERVRAMLDGKPVDRLPCMPITMMFAADHIGVRFLNYAVNYRHMTEGQIRISQDYDLDYVNTMSDPACEAFDCGGAVSFFPDQPPAMDETNALFADKQTLCRFKSPTPDKPGRMNNRLKALATYKERVGTEKWIEGWVEGPCAEGADLRGINALMTDFFDDPVFVRDLFETIIEMELRFAKAQVEVGADAIGIGDAAASLVGPALYEEFVWPCEKKLVDGIHAMGVPVKMHICGNTRKLLPGLARLGLDMIDIDSPVPLSDVREALGPDVLILGNIDPVRVLRAGTPESVYAAIAECHRQAGPKYGIAAGCEVPRDTAPENLRAMIQYAKDSGSRIQDSAPDPEQTPDP